MLDALIVVYAIAVVYNAIKWWRYLEKGQK